MKLTPKAKPIRIRIVSGGEEHSSIETLRNNYSIADIQPLIKDGRLFKWLLRVGEKEAANCANKLTNTDTTAKSRDIVELTAHIFNTRAKSIEDLLQLWQKKYPKSFFNYIKAYRDSFKDISSVRKAYDSLRESHSEMSEQEWQDIFIATLKRMPLSTVLDDFRKSKSVKPMNIAAWLKVFDHHAESASEKELYLIAQEAYEYPGLKEDAVEWYRKSARTYIKAKEWLNKNLKPELRPCKLTPKEKELFDSFEKDPAKYGEFFFNSTYPVNLERFLKVLSRIYRTGERLSIEQITGKGEFTKYLYIIQKIHNVYLSTARKQGAILDLKQLPNVPTAHYFKNYQTLDKIITSLEKEEPIFGVQLWKCNNKQLVLFIAGLAKSELEHEKSSYQ